MRTDRSSLEKRLHRRLLMGRRHWRSTLGLKALGGKHDRISDQKSPQSTRGWARSGPHTDGLATIVGQSGDDQRQQWPKTIKAWRLEIGMWKQNISKESGHIVNADLSFDHLLSKYVDKKVAPRDQPTKRPHSSIIEREVKDGGPTQIRPTKLIQEVV